jgi:hypothetical protein
MMKKGFLTPLGMTFGSGAQSENAKHFRMTLQGESTSNHGEKSFLKEFLKKVIQFICLRSFLNSTFAT